MVPVAKPPPPVAPPRREPRRPRGAPRQPHRCGVRGQRKAQFSFLFIFLYVLFLFLTFTFIYMYLYLFLFFLESVVLLKAVVKDRFCQAQVLTPPPLDAFLRGRRVLASVSPAKVHSFSPAPVLIHGRHWAVTNWQHFFCFFVRIFYGVDLSHK